MDELSRKGHILLEKADALYATASYRDSFKLYEAAAELFEELEDWEMHVMARSRVGRYYIKITQYDTALFYINETAEIAILELSPDHDWVGYSYDHIGTCYYYKAIYHTSIEFYQKALKQRLHSLGEKNEMTARCYNNLGNCYLSLDNIDQALHYYQIALNIRNEILDQKDPSFAYTYTAIGTCLSQKGRHDECLNYFKKALSLRKENYGIEHPLTAYSLSDMAMIYQAKKLNKKALPFAEQALKVRIKVFGDQQHTTAHSYQQLGEILMDLSEEDRALIHLNKSLELRINIYGEVHPDVAESYRLLGGYYSKIKKEKEAIKSYKKEAFILIQIHGSSHQALAENNINLSKIYQSKRELKKALITCQKAFTNIISDFNDLDIYTNPIFNKKQSYNIYLEILSLKAELLDYKYLLDGSEQDLMFAQYSWSTCLNIIDDIRNSYLSENSKLNLSEQVLHIYEKSFLNIIQCYQLEQNDIYLEQAFVIAEKGKSAVLFSQMNELDARKSLMISSELEQQENELRNLLTQIDVSISIEESKKEKADSKIIEKLENQHFDTNRKYEKLIEEFEKSQPNYFDLKYKRETISLSQFQIEIKTLDVNKKSAILSYNVIQNIAFVFLIKPNDYKMTQIELGNDFKEKIDELNESISFAEFEDFELISSDLYQILIEPIKNEIKALDKLIIIRDSVMSQLPFETLVKPNQKKSDFHSIKYLIQEVEIVYHYSASLLLNSIKSEKINNLQEDSFLGLAPIDFVTNKEDLNSLHRTEEEINFVSSLFENSNKNHITFLKESATKENLIKHCDAYKFILISTHGFMSEDENLSGIYFTSNAKESSNILFTSEVYNLKLNASLVVLSSCASGKGQYRRGEGMVAINRGFLYAGSSSILYTQFDIPDESGSEFVKLFFQKIIKGQTYSKALKQTIEAIILNPKYSPIDWASFSLIGC